MPKPRKKTPPTEPQPIEPKYQKTPKQGKLCYEVLINDYLGQWLTVNKITYEFYFKATEELKVLKKRIYGKRVVDQIPDLDDIEAVAKLPSTPPQSQMHNTSGSDRSRDAGKRVTQPRPQPSIPQQHKNEEGGESNLNAAKANATEKQLRAQITKLQETNRELVDEKEGLYKSYSSLHIENRQLKEKVEMLKTQLTEAYENVNDIRLRLSKLAGDNMRSNNPNLADLSDPYRPTELGKMFGEIYDNEWSDAFEVASGKTEKDNINVLYNILMDTYKFCGEAIDNQTEAIDKWLIKPVLEVIETNTESNGDDKKTLDFKTALKDRRKQLAPTTAKQIGEVYSINVLPMKQGGDVTVKLPTKLTTYASKCCELCWFMVISDPPLVFSEERDGDDFASDIFRPYTRSQKDMEKPVIEMVVWPALYLHFKGALLSKGVAQPISGEGHNTK